MAITIPTVDEFTESTVMLVIREIAEYICGNNGLVAQINNNDITGFTSSYTNNVLKIDATKGDGSKLPVCNVTIEGGSSTGNPYPTGVSGTVGSNGNITFTITMSSGSPLTTTIDMNYFASTADLSDLQEQVTGIKPTITVNTNVSPPTITVSVNGTSSTANLPASGGINIVNLTTENLITELKNIREGDILILNATNSENNPIYEIKGSFICNEYKETQTVQTSLWEFYGTCIYRSNSETRLVGYGYRYSLYKENGRFSNDAILSNNAIFNNVTILDKITVVKTGSKIIHMS